MPLWCLSLVSIFIFFITEAVSAFVEVKGALGGEISFGLDTIGSPVSSIIWKQKTSTETVKAIEWDEDGANTPHPRFNGFASLNEKTGEITIKNLKPDHAGLYTIDVNSKEQEQKFTLIVMEPVPKPVILIEKIEGNPDVVYLRCEYSEKIIWRNSDGETLEGSVITPKGESITVKYVGNEEKSYTCTLKNDVSEETSDPVYENDLFEDLLKANFVSVHLWRFVMWTAIVVISMVFIILFLFIAPCCSFCRRHKTSRK